MVGKIPTMVSMYMSPTEMLVNKPAVFFCLKMWSAERSHREEIVGLPPPFFHADCCSCISALKKMSLFLLTCT